MRKLAYQYSLYSISAISLAFVVSMTIGSPVAEAAPFPISMDSRTAPKCEGEWGRMSAGPRHLGECGVGCGRSGRVVLEEHGCSRNVKVGDKLEIERNIYLAPTGEGCKEWIRSGSFWGKSYPACSVCGDGIVQEPEECDDGCDPNIRSVEKMPKRCFDGTSTCNNACKSKSLCGNGIKNSNEECDDGNTKDGDGCSSTCNNEPATIVFSPSPVPAGVPPTVAACNVLNNKTPSVTLLNKADKDKDSKTEFREEYTLQPFTVGTGKKQRTQWMALMDPRNADKNETSNFVLLSAPSANPDKPLASKELQFDGRYAPIERLFDISFLAPLRVVGNTPVFKIASASFGYRNPWQRENSRRVVLAQARAPSDSSAVSLETPVALTTTVTFEVGGAQESNKTIVIIPKDVRRNTYPTILFVDPKFQNSPTISTMVRNSSTTYQATLYTTSGGDTPPQAVASKEISVESHGGTCRPLDEKTYLAQKALRVLIVSANASVSAQQSTENLAQQILSYTPFYEFKSRLDIRYYDRPVELSCLQDVQGSKGRKQCADEILQTLHGACDSIDDVVIVVGTEGKAAWSVGTLPVVAVAGDLSHVQQGAVVAHAIAVRLGIGDEFEYDDQTAEFARVTPNCRIAGSAEDLPLVWRSVQGQGEKELTIGMIKGCGDFPDVGVKPTQASIMSNPLQFTGNPDGFGKVNQVLIRQQFRALK